MVAAGTLATRQLLEAEMARRAVLGHFNYLSRYANDIILLPRCDGQDHGGQRPSR